MSFFFYLNHTHDIGSISLQQVYTTYTTYLQTRIQITNDRNGKYNVELLSNLVIGHNVNEIITVVLYTCRPKVPQNAKLCNEKLNAKTQRQINK